MTLKQISNYIFVHTCEKGPSSLQTICIEYVSIDFLKAFTDGHNYISIWPFHVDRNITEYGNLIFF